MSFLLLLPTILSLLIFCAHLLRAGAAILIPFVIGSLVLLFIKHGLVARFFQLFLTLVAGQWVLVSIFMAHERQIAGEPWLRMVLILSGVAVFTFIAALLFETPPLACRYPRKFTF